jgi:hypothetical protein
VPRKEEPPQSGMRRVTIRMPHGLHDALLRRRDETRQSLNDMLIEAAAMFLGLPVPQVRKGIPGRKPRRGETGGKAPAPGNG